jgi:hypothetical protein
MEWAAAIFAAAGVPVPARKESGFMRVWIDAEQDLREALRARTGRWAFFLDVLRLATWSLPLDGQRMTLSQADFGAQHGLRPSEVSEAFKALAEVGALCCPQRDGKSKSWEISAAYATRQSDAKREAAIARQRREVAEAAAVAARKAAVRGVRLREVGPVVDGAIDDPRQSSLIK